MIEAYRILGVDAAAIGNHEFDFGPAGYDGDHRAARRRRRGRRRGAAGGAPRRGWRRRSFPFLSANLHRKGGAPTGWPSHRASTTHPRAAASTWAWSATPRGTRRPPRSRPTSPGSTSPRAPRRAVRRRHPRAARRGERAGGAPRARQPRGRAAAGARRRRRRTRARSPPSMAGLGADVPDLIVAGHRHAWMLGRGARRAHRLQRSARRRPGAHPLLPRSRGRSRAGRHRAAGGGGDAPPRTELGAQVAAAMAAMGGEGEAHRRGPGGDARQGVRARARDGRDGAIRWRAPSPSAWPTPPRRPRACRWWGSSTRARCGRRSRRGGALRRPLHGHPLREHGVRVRRRRGGGLSRFIENALQKDSSRERFPFGISGAKVRYQARRASGRPALARRGDRRRGEGRPGGDDAPVWLALSDFMLFGGDGLLSGVRCAPAATSQTRVREAWGALLDPQPERRRGELRWAVAERDRRVGWRRGGGTHRAPRQLDRIVAAFARRLAATIAR